MRPDLNLDSLDTVPSIHSAYNSWARFCSCSHLTPEQWSFHKPKSIAWAWIPFINYVTLVNLCLHPPFSGVPYAQGLWFFLLVTPVFEHWPVCANTQPYTNMLTVTMLSQHHHSQPGGPSLNSVWKSTLLVVNFHANRMPLYKEKLWTN